MKRTFWTIVCDDNCAALFEIITVEGDLNFENAKNIACYYSEHVDQRKIVLPEHLLKDAKLEKSDVITKLHIFIINQEEASKIIAQEMKKVSVKITDIDMTYREAIVEIIKDVVGCDLKTAKNITDILPGVVQSDLTQKNAQKLVYELSNEFGNRFSEDFRISFSIG